MWNQTSFIMNEETCGNSSLQKRRCYTVGIAVGYFRLPCGHSRRTRHCRSRAGAWHSMCELTHGMAGERHAMCESAFSLIVRCPECTTRRWIYFAIDCQALIRQLMAKHKQIELQWIPRHCKSQGMNMPMHWLKRVSKLHKHMSEKHSTTQLNYI